MRIELINTGSELLLGLVLNTNQQWICRQLANRGYAVMRQVSVPDTGSAIEEAAREALSRADWVITTGGLGPTSDDLTREKIAGLLGCSLRLDPAVLRRIEARFAARGWPMPESTRVQALIPEGASVLTNDHGTAPGLLLRLEPNPYRAGGRPSWLAMLPGPPRELRPMFLEQLLPRILEYSPPAEPCAIRTLRTTGIGESMVEERIDGPLRPLADRGLEIGYCARPGEVDIRFVARGTEAAALIEQATEIARGAVGRHLFGEGEEEIETVVVRLLRERRRTVAVAESCTGGLLGHRITSVAGASEVFLGGWITYSNAAKATWLGVPAEILEAQGAVSEATARAMAAGARRLSGADYAVAITGIAGPSGGTPDKPVGTVFIALAGPEEVTVLNPRNAWDRATFQHVTTQQALELLRRALLPFPACGE